MNKKKNYTDHVKNTLKEEIEINKEFVTEVDLELQSAKLEYDVQEAKNREEVDIIEEE